MAKENIRITPPEHPAVLASLADAPEPEVQAAPTTTAAPMPLGGMSPEQFAQFLAIAAAALKSQPSEKDQLETEELRLRAQERDRKRQERLRAQQVQAKEIKEKAEKRALQQKILCSHTKPNGAPRIGGQYLTDGTLYQFCLSEECGKEWINGKDQDGLPMPHHLRVDNRLIGGASVEGSVI